MILFESKILVKLKEKYCHINTLGSCIILNTMRYYKYNFLNLILDFDTKTLIKIYDL